MTAAGNGRCPVPGAGRGRESFSMSAATTQLHSQSLFADIEKDSRPLRLDASTQRLRNATEGVPYRGYDRHSMILPTMILPIPCLASPLTCAFCVPP